MTKPNAKPATIAKSKKARPKTKTMALGEIEELLGKIEQAEKAVQLAEIELDSRKEEAKTAKGVWMTRVAELRMLVRTRERWAEEQKRQPLLQPKADAKPSADGESKDATPAPAEDWRKLSVETLKLPEKLAEKLLATQYGTMGALVDLMREHVYWWHWLIPGVGPETAEKISNGMAQFWADHPEAGADKAAKKE